VTTIPACKRHRHYETPPLFTRWQRKLVNVRELWSMPQNMPLHLAAPLMDRIHGTWWEVEGGNRLDAFQVIIFLSQLLLYMQRQFRSTCGMGPEINFSRLQPALTSIICISPSEKCTGFKFICIKVCILNPKCTSFWDTVSLQSLCDTTQSTFRT